MAAKKATASPDAIKLLKADHEKVRGLLGQFENATGARREKLRGQIDRELKVHTQIEEEIFYPAFRDAARKKDDKKMYFEALEEHHVVDLVLPEMNERIQPEELRQRPEFSRARRASRRTRKRRDVPGREEDPRQGDAPRPPASRCSCAKRR